MEMRIKPLFAGGRRIVRPDSATYLGTPQLQEVWTTARLRREAAILVTPGGRRHEILPRLYHPRLVRILATGFILQGLEDFRDGGDRRLVCQAWRCELPDQSDDRFDQDWHPLIERRLLKGGISLRRNV